jgi:predicted esterase
VTVAALNDFVHAHVAPAAGPNARTTLLLLHGTGGDERDLLPLGAQLLPGARLLGVRGQVLENGMPRFFRRIAEGVFDEADIVVRAASLAAFVRAAADSYGFDPGHVTAIGYSNGANIAAALLLLHPGVLRQAVLFRTMVPLEPTVPPLLGGVRVLLAEGALDPIIPRENAARLAAMLQTAGADVALHWEPAGHALTANDLDVARRWLSGAVV